MSVGQFAGDTPAEPAQQDASGLATDLLQNRFVVNKRALGIAAAIMLFTGLVVLQVAQTARPQASQVITLPDGSPLRLLEVGYGKEHYRPGAWWHRLARQLPSDWQRKLKVDIGAGMSTPEPSLGVWLSWDKSGPTARGWWDFSLVDDQGVEVPARTRSSQNISRMGQPDVLGYAFTTLPRRSKTVTLRLYDRTPAGKRELAASIELNNPVRGKFPEWRPQPMPATMKQGHLEISFKQLLVGVGYETKPAPPKQGDEA